MGESGRTAFEVTLERDMAAAPANHDPPTRPAPPREAPARAQGVAPARDTAAAR